MNANAESLKGDYGTRCSLYRDNTHNGIFTLNQIYNFWQDLKQCVPRVYLLLTQWFYIYTGNRTGRTINGNHIM